MKTLLLLVIAVVSTSCSSNKPVIASGNHDATGPISEAKLGVKIYPGATIVTSGETDELVSANLRTPDSTEKVIAFYEAELGAKGTGDPTIYTISADKNGKKFAISINADGGKTNVSIGQLKHAPAA